MTARPRTLLLAALAAGALLLPGCGGDDRLQAGPGDAPPSTVAAPVLGGLRLDVSGGFVPVEAAFASVPRLTITAGGQVLTGAAVVAVYPGPLLAPLTTRTLDEAGRAAVARLVVDSGLATSPAPDFGVPGVADAPTTTLTVVLDGTTVELVAPALEEALPDDAALSAPQQALRTELRALVAALGDLEGVAGGGHLGPEAPYVPEAVWLQAAPAADAPAADGAADGPEPTVVPWRVPDVDLATLTEPRRVDGAAGRAALAVLAEADQLTRFEQAGVTYVVLARPAMPDDGA